MPNKHTDKFTQELFREYTTNAVRKKYKGNRSDIRNTEGFAWYSTMMNRWCFLPLRAYFSLDTVIRVDGANLRNV
jgi:hypothetical protein